MDSGYKKLSDNIDDRLGDIFKLQDHDDEWYDKERLVMDKNYRQAVMKELALGMYDQVSKFISSFDWKRHVLEGGESVQNAIDQLIDINKYTISAMRLLGVNSDSYYNLFNQKTNVLIDRWKSIKMVLNESVNVIVFDIDGVIANYDSAYMDFIESNGYKKNTNKRDSYSYYKMYGIDRLEEEKLNDTFVSSGGFVSLKPYVHIVNFMNWLRFNYSSVKIVLITARPHTIHKRLIVDTNEWLSKNHIPYDLLLFSKDKSDAIINNILPANVICFIEDRDKHAIEISHLGIDVALIDKDYNRNIGVEYENIYRIFGEPDNQIKQLIKFVELKLKK